MNNFAPFDSIPFFEGHTSKRSSSRNVASFKGLIAITPHPHTHHDPFQNAYLSDMLTSKQLFLRLYILRARNLRPHDHVPNQKPSSDPYLRITFGKLKHSTRSRYVARDLNPDFFESFEFPVVIPGPSTLRIQVWDFDNVSSDDMIGETCIDIEDRWYSSHWRDLKRKTQNRMPLEHRSLHLSTFRSKNSSVPSTEQGKLELWLEILTPLERKTSALTDIAPPPQSTCELRVVVWECKEVMFSDKHTFANDLYVTCELEHSSSSSSKNAKNVLKFKKGLIDQSNLQRTDLHFRSHDGCGTFNWRMKFDVTLPKHGRYLDYPRLKLQIWDKDYLSPDDNISECVLPLAAFLRFAEVNADGKGCRMIKREKKGKDEDEEHKIWIDMSLASLMQEQEQNLMAKLKDGMDKVKDDAKSWAGMKQGKGSVLISVEVVGEEWAKLYPVGLGRELPNKYPFLAEPSGRMKFDWLHPFSSVKHMLGDKFCAKLCCVVCWAFCLAFLLFITPSLISSITANVITS